MKLLNTLSDPLLPAVLKSGEVGVMPTDTVYGIVCDATQPAAVERLYQLKRREQKPGTLIAASIAQFMQLGLDTDQLKTVAHLWPDALSVIIDAPASLAYLHVGKQSLVARIPKDERLRALLEQTGPLLTSSANMPGAPTAANVAEAQAYFGEAVDFYVDGGTLTNRLPSTIIRVLPDKTIELVRDGAVKINTKGERI
ncbi:MAG TPA: L-threonylcarbamoyladenylate synthase [Candidatus Saccharimonadales bacterium]|jgi:L-threonylcarbamoyladenylate synthase|nr:L-threonylcarbamoyladenylate synthase [Candidatus Saccharimonadales bacterium]